MDSEEKNRWDAKYREHPESWTEPDEFLKRVYGEFLRDRAVGRALDLAGGAGRNSIFLVERGWQVDLVDISNMALDLAREKARWVRGSGKGSLSPQAVDLNTEASLGEDKYDLIVVFYFLRRELFPVVIQALKPGGMLIYRTYTIDRMQAPGGPVDPQYLLQPDELRKAFAALETLSYNETKSGKAAAELVGRKTRPG